MVWAENRTGTDDSKGIEAGPESDVGVTRIWNNIVYGFQCTEPNCIGVQASNGAVDAFRNTVVDCRLGIEASSLVDTLVLKNNLSACHAVDAVAVDFGPLTNAAHAGNVSSDGTSPDGLLANRAVRFAGAAVSDFHLDASDTGAKGQGLSSLFDPIQRVSLDGTSTDVVVMAGDANMQSVARLHMDDAQIYWVEPGEPGRVMRAGKGGDGLLQLDACVFGSSEAYGQIAGDADSIVYSTQRIRCSAAPPPQSTTVALYAK